MAARCGCPRKWADPRVACPRCGKRAVTDPPSLFDPPPDPPRRPPDPPRARRTDPETSHAAARRAQHGQVDRAILEALERVPNATTKELVTLTARQRVSVSPRMRPLTRVGLVRPTPVRRGGGIAWELVR